MADSSERLERWLAALQAHVGLVERGEWLDGAAIASLLREIRDGSVEFDPAQRQVLAAAVADLERAAEAHRAHLGAELQRNSAWRKAAGSYGHLRSFRTEQQLSKKV